MQNAKRYLIAALIIALFAGFGATGASAEEKPA